MLTGGARNGFSKRANSFVARKKLRGFIAGLFLTPGPTAYPYKVPFDLNPYGT